MSKNVLSFYLKLAGYTDVKQVGHGDCETTVRPMAAFWHPCHRGIRESIHIKRGGRASIK